MIDDLARTAACASGPNPPSEIVNRKS